MIDNKAEGVEKTPEQLKAEADALKAANTKHAKVVQDFLNKPSLTIPGIRFMSGEEGEVMTLEPGEQAAFIDLAQKTIVKRLKALGA